MKFVAYEEYGAYDSRTPLERVGDGLLRQIIDEKCTGCTGDARRTGVTRSGRAVRVAPGGGESVNTACGCTGGRTARSEGGTGCTDRGGCGSKGGWGLYEYPLAMVYSPVQLWRGIDDPETGLANGTIFRELVLPFTAGGLRGGCCRG